MEEWKNPPAQPGTVPERLARNRERWRELARTGREKALCFLDSERWWTSHGSGLGNSIGMGMSRI
jgi:hypothetical protein